MKSGAASVSEYFELGRDAGHIFRTSRPTSSS